MICRLVMNDRDRALLTEIRHLLLRLHKTLIDWQRAEYERTHGRLQTSQLLQVIFDDPEFAWLRSMSGLIVRIDEALEAKEGEVDETGPLIAQVRELVSPAPDSPYAHRYHAALQELPDAVLARGALLTALKLQRLQSRA